MLPKLSRLNLKKDFEYVASGKKLETKYLKLFLKTRGTEFIESVERPKIGIAVSTKVFKKAVDRNRARRLASSAFESIYMHFPTNLNIVALPKVSILGVKSTDVFSDLEVSLKNAKIIG